MKKKIKYLTLKEVKKLCDKYLKQDEYDLYQCHKCPYANVSSCHCKLSYTYLDEYGNEKIEVEDDE